LLSENDFNYYFEMVLPSDSDVFSQSMTVIDRMIIGEGYSSAAAKLKKAVSSAQGSTNWLSIIKRAYIISEKTANFSLFDKYVKKAFKIYPGNEDIRALQVYSLIKKNNHEKADELAKALTTSFYTNLKIEAALGAEFSSETIADPFSYLLNLLSKSDDPAFFNKIGNITGNDKIIFDAAVLFMKEGETKKAFDISSRLKGDWLNDEAIGMISIDSQEYNHALTRFLNHNKIDINNHNQKWAIQLIIADLYHILGSYNESSDFYNKSIKINPNGAWNQYANYSRLLIQTGRYRHSMDIMQEGIALFPTKRKELIIAMVNNQFDKNRSTTERYLKSFLDDFPDDPEANLLYIDHFPIQTTPEKYGARIWELYNKNPSNRKIAEFLIWYLLGVGDLEGTELVLDRFDRDSGRSYWTIFYRALGLSMDKGFIEAENLLQESLKMKKSWYSYYNLAVIQIYLRKFQEALNNLNQAEIFLLRSNNIDNNYLSNIKTKTARSYFYLNENDKAKIELEKALKLNYENLEATLLSRELK